MWGFMSGILRTWQQQVTVYKLEHIRRNTMGIEIVCICLWCKEDIEGPLMPIPPHQIEIADGQPIRSKPGIFWQEWVMTESQGWLHNSWYCGMCHTYKGAKRDPKHNIVVSRVSTSSPHTEECDGVCSEENLVCFELVKVYNIT
jgi:hypothetical protein